MADRMKRCPSCRRWLPATPEHWHRASNRADGLQGECKSCRHERQRKIKGAKRRNRGPRSGYAQLTVYVSQDLKQAVRRLAAERGESQSMLLERAVRAEVARLIRQRKEVAHG